MGFLDDVASYAGAMNKMPRFGLFQGSRGSSAVARRISCTGGWVGRLFVSGEGREREPPELNSAAFRHDACLIQPKVSQGHSYQKSLVIFNHI